MIIQGGMGVGISGWRLARAVSTLGQLGVVSGTALDEVLARRLQMGDPGGHMRRALDHFPVARLADTVWNTFYIPGGKTPSTAFITRAQASPAPDPDWQALCVVANFIEVFLAREGHNNPVGINYLEKIQMPHLPSIYGAMLAGVHYVLMGAGIPLKIPGVLDLFVNHERATYPLNVSGAESDDTTTLSFDPRAVVGVTAPPLARPQFLAIIASDVLALTLHRRASGRVNGFIVEGPTAGGHNAPPRGALQLSERGEPRYGSRDVVNLDKLKALGLPYWLAGGSAAPGRLHEALEQGAEGIQVGTAFALCAESGLREDFKRTLRQQIRDGATDVFTDPRASPTGFPFKVARVPGTLSEAQVLDARPRICDLGYLREAYRGANGGTEFRCPAEPVNVFESKGGTREAASGRVCICNALVATAGLPQVRAGKWVEPGIVTMGDDLPGVARFLSPETNEYSAADVIDALVPRAIERGRS